MHINAIILMVLELFDRAFMDVSALKLPADLIPALGLNPADEAIKIVLENRGFLDQVIPDLLRSPIDDCNDLLCTLSPRARLAILDRLLYAQDYLIMLRRSRESEDSPADYRIPDLMDHILIHQYKDKMIHAYLSSRDIPYILRLHRPVPNSQKNVL